MFVLKDNAFNKCAVVIVVVVVVVVYEMFFGTPICNYLYIYIYICIDLDVGARLTRFRVY
jgi:hypothetical protein